MAKVNTERRARTGQKVPAESVRNHCVSVRLDSGELAMLDKKRGKHRRGEWLRMSGLDGQPKTAPQVPEANADLSLRLGKLLGAFGSLMSTNKLTHDKEYLLLEIRTEVVKLRKQLEGEK